jgi:ABC-type enterochelin transport system substrate-binding protein
MIAITYFFINCIELNKENPDVILAMDRGQAVSGKSTAKQALNNPVLKNVKAVRNILSMIAITYFFINCIES